MKRVSIILLFVFISTVARAELKVWNGEPNIWNDETQWTPTGVPTVNDDVLVTAGQAVLFQGDGACASFTVTNTGFLSVNDANRTLQVASNGTVNGNGTELRVNSGHLNVGGSVTLLNDARMILDSIASTATVHSLDPRDGILEWNAGTLRFTDNLWMESGNPISNLTVETGRTLEVLSPTIFGVELYLGSGGALTLAGGDIVCDAFAKTAAGTFNFDDGTLQVNGDGFDWDGSPFTVEGSTSTNLPTLVLNEFALPMWVTLTNGISVAPTPDRQGHLLVDGYSNLDAAGILGNGLGSRGSATVTNVSTWKAHTLTVGGAGTGTLTIQDNSRVQDCSKIEVGRDSTATGLVTVAGAGSQLAGYWQTQIGGHGRAIVEISDGASLLFDDQIADTEFARYSGSQADMTLTGPGSQFGITSDAYSHTIYFGLKGHASLIVSNGATVTWDEFTRIGETSGSRGDIMVTGSQSSWTVDDDLWMGYEGTGTLQVLDGASAHTDEAKLGEFPGGVGQALVSGTGSTWHGGGYDSIGGEFLVGRYGTGEITVEKGGVLHSSGLSMLGYYSGSRGTVTVTDTGSLWAVSGKLELGFFQSDVTGRLTVANGGLVTVSETASLGGGGTIVLNGGAQGSGTLDAKTLDLTQGTDIVGDSNGILRVHSVTARPANWTLPATLQIGSTSHQAAAHWTIDSGESLTVDADFCIGYDAEATLNITNGGQVASGSGVIGQIYGAAGDVTVTGSSASWNVSSNLTISQGGRASLTLIDGACVTADQITINGYLTWSNGTHIGSLILIDNGCVAANQITINPLGNLSGNGSISGNISNAGFLSPGSSSGTLSVTGNVELLGISQLEMELAGTTRGTEFDALDVSGNLSLDGILAVTLDGFTPALGDRFDLLDFGSATGTFDYYDLPTLPDGQEWYTGNLSVDGTLGVSLPTAWLAKYGLSPTNDPFADPDNDQYSTAEEYTANTNPTNGASYFQVDDVDGYPDPTIHFNSSTDRVYTLSICSNMLGDTWADVPGAGPRLGMGGPDTFQDTNEPVQGFFYYRLGVDQP